MLESEICNQTYVQCSELWSSVIIHHVRLKTYISCLLFSEVYKELGI